MMLWWLKQQKFGCNGQHARFVWTFLRKLLHEGKNKNSWVICSKYFGNVICLWLSKAKSVFWMTSRYHSLSPFFFNKCKTRRRTQQWEKIVIIKYNTCIKTFLTHWWSHFEWRIFNPGAQLDSVQAKLLNSF